MAPFCLWSGIGCLNYGPIGPNRQVRLDLPPFLAFPAPGELDRPAAFVNNGADEIRPP